MRVLIVAIFLILVTISATVYGVAAGNPIVQGFAAPKRDVFLTNFANHSGWVGREGMKRDWAMKEIRADAPDAPNASEITKARPGTLVVGYPNDNIRGNVLAEAKGYFVALASMETAFRRDCSFNLGGMTVGYFDRADLQFIQALIAGYRMDESQISLVYIPPVARTIMTLGKRLRGEEVNDSTGIPAVPVDMVLTYIIPKSPFHRLLQSQYMSVMGFKTLDIERLKIFMPEIGIEEIKLKTLFFDIGGTAAAVMDRENDTRLPTMISRVYEVSEPPPKKSILDAFVTNYEMEPASLDPTYKCYGDDTQVIRALCESAYDPIGMPKTKQTVWDQPCTRNADCPFWDSSQKRGGCNVKDGTCELPVAVKRLGYKKFDDTGMYAPFKRNGKFIFASEAPK